MVHPARLRTYVRKRAALDPEKAGDLGEASAIEWLAAAGAAVFTPIFSAPHYDLVADFGDGPVRVQVKTFTCRSTNRWEVTLCTRGGNQSWSGLVKKLEPDQ